MPPDALEGRYTAADIREIAHLAAGVGYVEGGAARGGDATAERVNELLRICEVPDCLPAHTFEPALREEMANSAERERAEMSDLTVEELGERIDAALEVYLETLLALRDMLLAEGRTSDEAALATWTVAMERMLRRIGQLT